MNTHAHSFAERHPEKRDAVMALATNYSAFNDICARFGRLWDCLNEMDPDGGDTARMSKEVQHLEAEMLAMFHDNLRV